MVESWKECLPELLQGYSSNNIYNLDETGCFWWALPESGFGIKEVQCHGGKKSKHKFTVVLIVNADGEKEVLMRNLGVLKAYVCLPSLFTTTANLRHG